MTAPFLPGHGADIGAALSSIGGSIGQLLDPNRERRRMVQEFILANPEIGQQFAAAQREQERGFLEKPPPDIAAAGVQDVAPNVLEQFGFDLSQTKQTLEAFPESQEERLAGFRKKAGIARLTAEAELAKLREDAAKSGLGAQLALARLKEGIPRRQAKAEAFELALGTKLNKRQLGFLDEYDAFLEDLKVSNPFEYQRALISESSAEFLQDIQFREELAAKKSALEIERTIAALGRQPTALDIFKVGLDAQGNLDTQLDRWRKSLEEGNEEERQVALQRINEAATLVRAVSPGGAQFAVDPGKKSFWAGRLAGFRVTRLAPGTLALPLAVQYERLLGVFEAADPTTPFEQLRAQLMQSPEGQAFLGGLTPRELAKFWTDAQAQLGSLAGVTVLDEEDEEAEGPTSVEILTRDIGRAVSAFARTGKRLGALSRGQGFATREERIAAFEKEIASIDTKPKPLSEERRRQLNRLKLELERLRSREKS